MSCNSYRFLAPEVEPKEQNEDEIYLNVFKVVYWSQQYVQFLLDGVTALGHF